MDIPAMDGNRVNEDNKPIDREKVHNLYQLCNDVCTKTGFGATGKMRGACVDRRPLLECIGRCMATLLKLLSQLRVFFGWKGAAPPPQTLPP